MDTDRDDDATRDTRYTIPPTLSQAPTWPVKRHSRLSYELYRDWIQGFVAHATIGETVGFD